MPIIIRISIKMYHFSSEKTMSTGRVGYLNLAMLIAIEKIEIINQCKCILLRKRIYLFTCHYNPFIKACIHYCLLPDFKFLQQKQLILLVSPEVLLLLVQVIN